MVVACNMSASGTLFTSKSRLEETSLLGRFRGKSGLRNHQPFFHALPSYPDTYMLLVQFNSRIDDALKQEYLDELLVLR